MKLEPRHINQIEGMIRKADVALREAKDILRELKGVESDTFRPIPPKSRELNGAIHHNPDFEKPSRRNRRRRKSWY